MLVRFQFRAVAVVSLVVLSACGKDKDGDSGSTSTSPTATPGAVPAAAPTPGPQAPGVVPPTTTVSPEVTTPTPAAAVSGHFYYSFADKVFRIAAKEGAVPEDVSAALAKLSPGTRDRRLSASVDGSFLVVSTDRFGCSGECLALIPNSLASGMLVKPAGAEISSEGIAAVSSAGDLVVFASQGGPHNVDIYATRLQGGQWGAATLLSGSSTYAFNNMPALSFDGQTVTFDCGVEAYPESGGNAACEVKIDGTGFRKVIGHDALANARNAYVQNPHQGLDGLLFESSWPIGSESPETIWLLPAAGGAPQPIAQKYPNAVSPCPLSDGRFGILWLGRPANPTGAHELAVVSRDGQTAIVLTPNVDVSDIGIGCSN